MATYMRSTNWLAARARASEVARVAVVVDEAISAIPVENADSPPERLRIGVTMPGVEDSFASVDEFTEGVAALPLNKVKVNISGHSAYGAAHEGSVYVFLGTTRVGAVVVVQGTDQRWVEGTFALVRKAVEPLAQRPRSRLGFLLLLVPILGGSAAAAFLHRAGWAWVLAEAVVAVGTLYIFGMNGWLPFVPTFRLLPDDAARTGERARQLGRPLLLLVIGAVVYALANRWLG